jgi:hypothetical protein
MTDFARIRLDVVCSDCDDALNERVAETTPMARVAVNLVWRDAGDATA